MILKRQDLLGEQGSYLTEEALASLAASDVLRQLDPLALRPSAYFNTVPAATAEPVFAPSAPNPAMPVAAEITPPQPPKAEVTMTTITAPQPVFSQPTAPTQTPAQNIFSTAYATAPAPAANIAPSAPPQPAGAFHPSASPAAAPAPRLQTMRAASEGRRLEVGPDISLNGEISTCDILMVRGHVQAALKDCRQIEIAAEGFFKGNAEIDDAIISGQYEGHLVVRGRLHVTSTGRIAGSVRYGTLQIDPGAEINGDVQSLANAAQRPMTQPAQAAPAPARAQNRGGGFSNPYGSAAGSF